MLDYLFTNATIVDGTGAAAYQGSVGIEGDKIVTILHEGSALPEAKKVIDAAGKVLCPGFIDIHSHADETVSVWPNVDNCLVQGVTTFVGGNCGGTLAPAYREDFVEAYVMGQLALRGYVDIRWKSFGEWLDYVKTLPLGPNYVPLVGHCALRGSILGADYNRESTSEEEDAICRLLQESLDQGAFGMTYSADPGPGARATDSELEKLFRVLEKNDSYVSLHARHHQYQWPSEDGRQYYGVYVGERGEVICGRYHGFVEFVELLRKTPGLTGVISHMHSAFHLPMPHSQELENALVDETLRTFIDEPVAEGIDIYFNIFADGNSLCSIRKAAEDMTKSIAYHKEFEGYTDPKKFVEALSDPAFREKMKTFMKSGKFKLGMLSPALDAYWADCYTILTAKDSSLVNRTLMDIAKERTNGNRHQLLYNDCMEVLFDLLCEDPDLEAAQTIDKRENQGSSRMIQHPRCMMITDSPSFPIDSDKWLNVMGYGNPPVAYTSYVRMMATLCRDQGLISREEAIRRATTLPADIMRIHDRGRIQEGMKADLLVLDWENLNYVSDFNHPTTPPTGIDYVFVNGVPALENNQLTRAGTGRILSRND